MTQQSLEVPPWGFSREAGLEGGPSWGGLAAILIPGR